MINLALIGAGSMGKGLTKPVKDSDFARVIHVCDPDRENAEPWADELGAHWHEAYQTALADDAVDAVIVGAPQASHAPISIAALQAGKHVFCEKPMALSVQQCDEMIEAARKADRKLMIGHCLRFDPASAETIRLATSGELAKPRAAVVRRSSYRRNWQGWRRDRALHGGMLLEVGVHEIDLVCAILGDPIDVDARCTGVAESGFENLVSFLVRFPEDRFASFTYGMKDPWGRGFFEVYCEEGALRRVWSRQEPAVEVHRDGDEEPVMRNLEPADWTERQMRAFCIAVEQDRPVPVPGQVGRRAVSIAEAAVKSYGTGRPADVS